MAQIRLSQRALDSLVKNAGLVDDFMDDLGEDAQRLAKQMSPIRSGRLHRGIGFEVTSNGRDICTLTLGTTGVDHATLYLQEHPGAPAVPPGGRAMPIGFALMQDGVAFGNVNRRPGRRYPGNPVMFTYGSTQGWGGNNILGQALALVAVSRGLKAVSVTG